MMNQNCEMCCKEFETLPEHLQLTSLTQVEPVFMNIMPIAKLGSSNYLLGTQCRKVNVQKGQLQVKTETGYTSLIEYLEK